MSTLLQFKNIYSPDRLNVSFYTQKKFQLHLISWGNLAPIVRYEKKIEQVFFCMIKCRSIVTPFKEKHSDVVISLFIYFVQLQSRIFLVINLVKAAAIKSLIAKVSNFLGNRWFEI